MERTSTIIRRSIHIFLKNYQYFTSTATALVLPVSVAILLSQAVMPSMSPFMATIYARLESLFGAAGFPSSSEFFSLLNIKISQTIFSSIFTLPFTLSFLLFAKANIIQSLSHLNTPTFSSVLPIFNNILCTHLCNSFIIVSANASAFFLFFLAFNSLDSFGLSSNNFVLFLSAVGAVLYSVILANTLITCNLALVVAGMENCGGFLAILKACVLIRGRAAIALSLALPVNFGFAALEALYQFRVVTAYRLSNNLTPSVAFEGLLVAYLYAVLILVDTITTCIFYKSCKSSSLIDECTYYKIELADEEDNGTLTNSKILHELP
ncbi:hypothetical protein IFM89_003100 [Coptis chinensis]|uniref:Transmembrane protein n=1 Tax=Coptis chinensis TaxID=261450 RepID=A0A835MDW0_9MAGN|nr:hypothetical protein IFM89_003100 [Coptis chinensis]